MLSLILFETRVASGVEWEENDGDNGSSVL